jgi:hypothetical protein
VDAAQEARVLLFVGNREPVFDELDPRTHQHAFEFRHGLEEFFVLIVAAESHHALDAGAVVPAAVEQHDLAGGRQVRDVTLEIPLGALAVVGRRQRRHPAHARVQALRDALDDAALAGGIAALEQDHHLVPGVHHPVLQLDQFGLQAEQLAEVALARRIFHALVGIAAFQLRQQRVGIEAAVVEFEFQLFVVAVEEIALDALDDVFMAVEFFHGLPAFRTVSGGVWWTSAGPNGSRQGGRRMDDACP